MKKYGLIKGCSPATMVKKSYDVLKDVCKGLYVTTYGARDQNDLDFAREVGIKPKYGGNYYANNR